MVNDLKTIIIAIVCIVTSVLVSGFFVYRRFHLTRPNSIGAISTAAVTTTPKAVTSIPTSIQSTSPTPSIQPTIIITSDTNLKEAMQALDNFNLYLFGKEYEKASALFDWNGFGDPQVVFGSDYVAGDHAKTLTNVCQHPNFCLRFYKILKTRKISDGEYQFTIQYQTKDNQIFVESVHVSGSFVNNTDFLYNVKKINGQFKVVSPPNNFITEAEPYQP